MANELVGMCWLIDFPSPPMRLVMMKICDCADPDGTNIFPSVNTIRRETGLGESTIRAANAAFEECGLLVVKANKFGNRAGKTTTVRELDTDLLRLVTGKRNKGKLPTPSTHVFARGRVEIPADVGVVTVPGAAMPSFVEKRSETRTAHVWAIFIRRAEATPPGEPTPPGGGGVEVDATPPGDGGAPLPDVEGYPSSSGTPPLQEVDPTPPGGGSNPSLDPSLDPSPPPPRKKRGARERENLLEEVRSAKPQCGRAMDKLFTPLLTRIRFDAPLKAFALGTLVEWAEKQTDGVLEETLQLLTTPGGEHYRGYDVRPTNVEVAMKLAIANAKVREAVRNSPYVYRGTPEFAAAIAKIAESHPTQADWFRSREFFKRDEVARYGALAAITEAAR